MRKQAGPSAKDLADVEAAEKFINNEEHSVIGEHIPTVRKLLV